jgi:hypothetical protein
MAVVWGICLIRRGGVSAGFALEWGVSAVAIGEEGCRECKQE